MDTAIVLCSGGLDSTTAAFLAKRDFAPDGILLLFVDYGQRALAEEFVALELVAKELNAEIIRLDMGWLAKISTSLINSKDSVPIKELKDLEDVSLERSEVDSWTVPARNALFVMAALAHAESLSKLSNKSLGIVLGIKKEGEVSFKDSSPEFVSAMNVAARESIDSSVNIIAPLMDFDKDEIVQKAQELGVPLHLTFSCYVGAGFVDGVPVHCGTCSACRQRQAAFYWAGIVDPSLYKVKVNLDDF